MGGGGGGLIFGIFLFFIFWFHPSLKEISKLVPAVAQPFTLFPSKTSAFCNFLTVRVFDFSLRRHPSSFVRSHVGHGGEHPQ